MGRFEKKTCLIIPCFVQNHIKYADNDFTMFGAKTLAELCLCKTNVLGLTIDECPQWTVRGHGQGCDTE
jgi:hypothetical protein